MTAKTGEVSGGVAIPVPARVSEASRSPALATPGPLPDARHTVPTPGCPEPFAINIAMLHEFLRALGADGEPITFQTFSESPAAKERMAGLKRDPLASNDNHGMVDNCTFALQRAADRGAGIYWMVNCGDGRGTTKENVTAVRAVYVDLDNPDPANLHRLRDCKPAPHAIIESSPGKFHAYWMVFDCALDWFEPMQRALCQRFGGDPSVHNLNRVMRLPGTWHQKGEPFMARLVHITDAPAYSMQELQSGLGLLPDPPKGAWSTLEGIKWPVMSDLVSAMAKLKGERSLDRDFWIKIGHGLRFSAPDYEAAEQAFADWTLRGMPAEATDLDRKQKENRARETFQKKLRKPNGDADALTIFTAAKEDGWKASGDTKERIADGKNERRRRQSEAARCIGEYDADQARDFELSELLMPEQMTERFVWVMKGSRVFDRKHPARVLTWAEFCHVYAGSKITTSDDKDISSAALWLNAPDRRAVLDLTFRAGGGMIESMPDGGADGANTWVPFDARPASAAGSEPFVEHVRWLFGDRAEEFLDWLAHIEQKPGELPHTGWLHIANNVQGLGRNWISCVLARVWRRNAATNFELEDALTTGFNGRLSRKVFVAVDEIRVGNTPNAYKCARRPNFDHPCRLNADQGWKAASGEVGCG